MFFIRFIVFDHREGSVQNFVSHSIENTHFVFAFGYFSQIVGSQFTVQTYGTHCGQMKNSFQVSVSILRQPASPSDECSKGTTPA